MPLNSIYMQFPLSKGKKLIIHLLDEIKAVIIICGLLVYA